MLRGNKKLKKAFFMLTIEKPFFQSVPNRYKAVKITQEIFLTTNNLTWMYSSVHSPSCTSGGFSIFTKKYGIVCTTLFIIECWFWNLLTVDYFGVPFTLTLSILSKIHFFALTHSFNCLLYSVGDKKETFNPKSEARSRGLIPNQMKLGSPIRTNVQILRNKYWSSWVLRKASNP